jgi:hypothetical protein
MAAWHRRLARLNISKERIRRDQVIAQDHQLNQAARNIWVSVKPVEIDSHACRESQEQVYLTEHLNGFEAGVQQHSRSKHAILVDQAIDDGD